MSHMVHHSLQQSLFALLSGDAELNQLISGVFDSVPKQANYPYITIDAFSSRDWSTRTSLGFSTAIPLRVFGQKSKQQVIDIVDRLYEIIIEGNITLLDHQLVAIRFETHEIKNEADGITRTGRIVFRAYSEFVPV